MQPTAQKNNAKQRKTIAIVAVIAVVAIALAAVAIITVANKREMTQAASDTCTLNAKALATHQQNFEEAQKEAEDAAKLTVDDVADGICKKLIFRHPHVFGDGGEGTAESWEALKRREKGQTTYTATLEAVAKSLPGLWRAEKLQSKAEKAGFEWPNAQAALDKLAEELGELQSAVADDTNIKEELGDVLFAAVKVARFFHIDPEEALEGTCEKFIRRFSAVEAAVTAQGQDLKDVDVSQLMVYWNRAKHPAKDEIEETEEEKGQST